MLRAAAPRVLSLLFCLLVSDSFAFAQETASWGKWEASHQDYVAGRYDSALHSLLATPSPDDPTYYYDLGTVAYRVGKTGAALAYFEKANHLRRHDPDTQHNLEIVRQELAHVLGDGKLDPASTWSESLADQVSIEEIRGVLGLVALILALFWIRGYRKTRDILKTLAQASSITSASALILVVSLYALEIQAMDRPAVIALEHQSVRTGPGLSYNEVAQVEAGTRLREIGESQTGTLADGAHQDEPWLQVRYNRDSIGWVRSAGFLKL